MSLLCFCFVRALMKGLLSVYIAITFVVAGYSIITTNERDSFGKDHFTEGLMWPVSVFNYVFEPELDGDSIDSLIDSVVEVAESRDSDYEAHLAAVAFNRIILLDYVESQPNLNRGDVQKLAQRSSNQNFGRDIKLDPQRQSDLMERLDGLDYDELVSLGDISYERVIKIARDRDMYSSGEECVDGLIRAYRREKGADAMIKYDILQEFDEMCGL
ncbi:hypothetical protein L5157_004358 [Vibrio parahaemolyticus]|uniref:hypothetical protein n=2 Tax=Vibrio parahaemolyticus TaxID=670 RepID=UPI00111EC540|nr:hypothetical protein [Vibrio parahaemolyticus]EIU6822737.1 hypothetical protein [Vibrio parahaemolyticus]MBE3994284.1 hypothetical protein [Vibrio parahaemolyticus]